MHPTLLPDRSLLFAEVSRLLALVKPREALGLFLVFVPSVFDFLQAEFQEAKKQETKFSSDVIDVTLLTTSGWLSRRDRSTDKTNSTTDKPAAQAHVGPTHIIPTHTVRRTRHVLTVCTSMYVLSSVACTYSHGSLHVLQLATSPTVICVLIII